MGTSPPKRDYAVFYGPLSTEALAYVALTITTVAAEAAILAATLSSARELSLPWVVFALVVVSVLLSYIFAMAAIARLELLSHVAARLGFYDLPNEFTQRANGEPIAHRFMRGWFKAEKEFFGFGQTEGQTQQGPIGRLSSGRVVGALVALSLYNSVILYVLASHAVW